jgi:signal transduction histidine kinase
MLILLHLFALLLLVSLGFYIFVANPRSRANQTFATFISFLALWTIKDLTFWNFQKNDDSAAWWASASFTIALLMQYSLVIFAWIFPENKRTPKQKAAVLFAPSLVLIPAALFGLLWNRAIVSDGKFIIELAPLAFVFVIYVYAVFGYGAIVLLKKYREYQGTEKAQQVGAILWGLLITGVLKTLANIILPFFGIYDFLPYSAILVLPGVLIYAYAISNFRLFTISTSLDQFRLFPISYKIALSIATVAIMSFAMFQIPIAWIAFRNGMDFEAWKIYLVFSVISALFPNLLLVLLIMRSLSRPLQKITLAAVQVTNGEYGTEVELRETNDEFSLLSSSFNEMSRKMKADISELSQLNEQLIRTEKLASMGTLSAGLAHEVNNPLAAISSLVQILQNNETLDNPTLEKLRLVQTQITRIKQVTADMMDFARVRPAAKSLVDINEIIEISLRLASFDKSFSRLNVNKMFSANLPRIYADSDQLQQVFLNFFLNSRDAIDTNGNLTITTKLKNEIAEIQIIDDGKGIEEANFKKIFDPFFTTKSSGNGTGLGLAVCYGIITAHGGDITVSKTSLGETCFAITLPIAKI